MGLWGVIMDEFTQCLDGYCNLLPSLEQPPATRTTRNRGALIPNIEGKSTKHTDLHLYGVIGSSYVNASKLNQELKAAGEVNSITVYLNTIGGTFADGLPIYNLLRQQKAHITVKVMGYALSMGSVIMLAGDRIECAGNSLIMIHRAHGLTWGDASAHRKAMEILDKHDGVIIPAYIRRMGKTESQVKALLQDETWYTAKQAKAEGLVDAITADVDIDIQEAQRGEENMGITANYHAAPIEFSSKFRNCCPCH